MNFQCYLWKYYVSIDHYLFKITWFDSIRLIYSMISATRSGLKATGISSYGLFAGSVCASVTKMFRKRLFFETLLLLKHYSRFLEFCCLFVCESRKCKFSEEVVPRYGFVITARLITLDCKIKLFTQKLTLGKF